MRLKFNCIIPLTAGKCCCRCSKINALIHIQICLGIHSILFKNILKYHLRHSACSASQYIFSFKIFKRKILFLRSSYKEVSCPLC